MKYMMLFIDTSEGMEGLDDPAKVYEEIGKWWGEHAQAGRILEGYELQPARTATTVHRQNGHTVVTDGPFIEAKESVGGYGIIEVPDLDAAIALASTWPSPNSKVEIRPLAQH